MSYEGETSQFSDWAIPFGILIGIGIIFVPYLYYSDIEQKQTEAEFTIVKQMDCNGLKQFILESIESHYTTHKYYNSEKAKDLHEWKCEK